MPVSVKIRCSECRKKISVDEAFAGSMCRCPYCKSIVRVPMSAGSGQARAAGRPAAPGGRPSRPGSPGQPTEEAGTPFKALEHPGRGGVVDAQHVDQSELSDEQIAAIPDANPVFFQGVVTIVLIAILLAMTAASIYLGILVLGSQDDNGGAYVGDYTPPVEKELASPFLTGGPTTVCQSVFLDPPVGDVIEAGTSMSDIYLFARDAVRASVLSLRSSQPFALAVAQDGKVSVIGNTLHPGGANGEGAIRKPSRTTYDGGIVSTGGDPDLLGAVEVVLKLKPATVVVIVSRKPLDTPKQLGETIRQGGARLVLVVLGVEAEADEKTYRTAVESAGEGSKMLLYDSIRVLQDHYDERELPE